MLITSLQPNVTRAQATNMLRRPLLRLLLGKLSDVFDFYVPYRLFRVKLRRGQQTQAMCFAIDAATGRLDHYRFDDALQAEQMLEVETARLAPLRLDVQETFSVLAERLARQALLPGFFKIADLQTDDQPPLSIYLPYWIGIYERGGRTQLAVLDAVRGRFEGVRLREIVAEWLQAAPDR